MIGNVLRATRKLSLETVKLTRNALFADLATPRERGGSGKLGIRVAIIAFQASAPRPSPPTQRTFASMRAKELEPRYLGSAVKTKLWGRLEGAALYGSSKAY
jgi:hypothetical protein